MRTNPSPFDGRRNPFSYTRPICHRRAMPFSTAGPRLAIFAKLRKPRRQRGFRAFWREDLHCAFK
jgi:hypothetical protein